MGGIWTCDGCLWVIHNSYIAMLVVILFIIRRVAHDKKLLCEENHQAEKTIYANRSK